MLGEEEEEVWSFSSSSFPESIFSFIILKEIWLFEKAEEFTSLNSNKTLLRADIPLLPSPPSLPWGDSGTCETL